MDKITISPSTITTLFSTETLTTAWEQLQTDFSAFSKSIEWDEPFFIVIGCIHAFILLFLVLGCRNHQTRLLATFAVLTTIGFLLRPLNTLGSNNWKHLFTQTNYFDSRGVFISIFLGAPIIANLVVALVLLMRMLVKKLVLVKRKQFALEKKSKEDGKKKNNQKESKKKR